MFQNVYYMATLCVLVALLVVVYCVMAIRRGRSARKIEKEMKEGRRFRKGQPLLDNVYAMEDILLQIERGIMPGADRLRRAASDPQLRHELYTMLMYHRRLELYPKEFYTWEAFAEGDLVEWLCHPLALGAPPDEIELMARVPFGDVVVRTYFVFRYRVKTPHRLAANGWMAGVADPHKLDAELGPGGKHTQSRFDSYDSYTPQQHVQRVRDLRSKPGAEGLEPPG